MKTRYKFGSILIICLILLLSYLYFNTSVFFAGSSSQPIQVFYSESQGTFSNGVSEEKYDGITSVIFPITAPFIDSLENIQVFHNNFTQAVNFWYYTGGGNEREYNWTKANEYMANNNPDFLIKASFFNNSIMPVWSQVWGSNPTLSVETSSFFHETSYGVWDAEYLFDSGFTGLNAYNDTYLQANVQQMTFQITISNGYYIENAGLYKLEEHNNATILTQTISAGDTFHVTVRDENTDNIKALVGFANPLVMGALLGVLATEIYEGRHARGSRRRH